MRNKGINMLSIRDIDGAGPGDHTDGGGLFLRVSPKLKKVWVYRFSRQGQRPKVKLGVYPAMSREDARARRDEMNGWLESGLDPRLQTRPVSKWRTLAKKPLANLSSRCCRQ